MSDTSFGLPESVRQYLLAHSLREHPLLEDLRTVTRSDPLARMQISPEQGQFMALLLQLIAAKRYIEVGTFTGYSSLVAALAMPEDGRLVCCDISVEWTSIAKTFWQRAGVAHKVDLRLAPALETLDALLNAGQSESFDFAFIDADKENYLGYYERCLKLVRRGGLIAIDNTLWSGRVADASDQQDSTRGVRRFNDALHADQRVAISLLPIGDGLSLALKL
jgi:caffeoyl-CoA O-methyltransferase